MFPTRRPVSSITGRTGVVSRRGFATLLTRLAILTLIALLSSPGTVVAQTPTADYELVFDSTWSEATHPNEFPGGAHYSPLIGGTHDANVAFWAPGELASLGIERMAETGSTSQLTSEIGIEISAGFADQVLVGFGFSSPGNTSLSFTVDRDFPQLTLVSMIAPSPDWFVGVHDLPLFDRGWWVPEVVVDLYVYDAGTDLGVTYASANQDADPALPISLQGYPVSSGVPVGTFTFTRLPEPRFALQLIVTLPFFGWLARRRRAPGSSMTAA